MKGYGISMPPVNAGIATDLETLLEAFKAKQSVRLIKFHEVAIDYELPNVYAGRLSLAELIELAIGQFGDSTNSEADEVDQFEECFLKSAFAYTRPTKGSRASSETTRTLTERVFGVYAAYVLYYAQPVDYVSKILVTQSDLEEIVRFCEEILLPGRHLDTVGCLYKLYVDDAFSIVAFDSSYDPICHRRYDLPNPDDDVIEEDEKHTPLVETAALMEDPVLKTMARVQQKMEDKQDMIEGCPKVAETNNNFLERIDRIFASLKNEIAKVDTGEVEEPENQPSTSSASEPNRTTEESTNRLSIKDKAYASKIVYARNRRYADPNMHENFAEVASEMMLVDPDTSGEKPLASEVPKSPSKKRRRKPNDVASDSGTAVEQATPMEETANEKPQTSSQGMAKPKAPRKSRAKKDKDKDADLVFPEIEALRTAARENEVLGIATANVTKEKKPRAKKAKKGDAAETATSSSLLDSLEGTSRRSGQPAPPAIDAEFEEKLKILAASLTTSEDDKRVKDLLG